MGLKIEIPGRHLDSLELLGFDYGFSRQDRLLGGIRRALDYTMNLIDILGEKFPNASTVFYNTNDGTSTPLIFYPFNLGDGRAREVYIDRQLKTGLAWVPALLNIRCRASEAENNESEFGLVDDSWRESLEPERELDYRKSKVDIVLHQPGEDHFRYVIEGLRLIDKEIKEADLVSLAIDIPAGLQIWELHKIFLALQERGKEKLEIRKT